MKKKSRSSQSKKEAREVKEYFENGNPLVKMGGITFSIIIIIHIAILMININASMWINKLEKIKCACSESYMRSYIKYFLYILIPISIINILLNIYMYVNNVNHLELSKLSGLSSSAIFILNIFNIIYVIFALTNIVIAIVFINKLKELNCECSEDIRREVYWIYNIVMASLLSIMFSIMILISIFYMSIFAFSSKK
jgi:hypothetical protein